MMIARPLVLLAQALCLLVVANYEVRGAEIAKPKGPVVLTVGGDIETTNRPPFDALDDAFFNYLDRTFDKAAAFDIAMLESLGLHEARLDYTGWPHAVQVEGPRLSDVLSAAGAEGKAITVVALDGFAVEISAEDVARLPWIVGIKAEGAYLGLGGRGPVWLVFEPPGGQAASAEDEGRWAWAVLYVEVR